MLFKGVGYGKEIEYPHKEHQKAGRTQILPCVATLESNKRGGARGRHAFFLVRRSFLPSMLLLSPHF